MFDFLRIKRNRTIMMALMDALIVIASAFLALLVRFDFMNISSIPDRYLSAMTGMLPFYVIIAIAVLVAFKLYNRVWTYASVDELVSTVEASFIIELILMIIHLFRNLGMPRSYYVLDFLFMAFLFCCLRFSKRVSNFILRKHRSEASMTRVMLVGAGAAATVLIRDFKRSGRMVAVCAIDDNKEKVGDYIMRVPIVGTRDDIKENVEKYRIDEIAIAMPSVSPSQVKDIVSICQDAKRPVKILPSVMKSMSGSLDQELRPVNYEDLLGRDPVKVNEQGIGEFISGKIIMVTGGGGSIGSELCRQIAKCDPKELLIFDIYENNAYAIEQELRRHSPELKVKALIGSVRDLGRLEQVFAKYRPAVIYHAAAHKHVPLMEISPNEAIKNNCLGTLNVARMAEKYGADKFILISTDKAVRPTSVMGASKRICEMIVQTLAKHAKNTTFAAVRFGNVLGSNGSVIPLFLKQIEEGGPVTVTHREITRFFMTISEAVSLVLQAGLYADGGEIFVLDMGEPVKIYDLAENLIKMKGFRPNEDIMIEISGLRKGEKLYEEILMDEEGLEKTENNLIYIGKPIKMDEESFIRNLEELIALAQKNGREIKEKLAEVCDTYTITDNK